jgi:enhancing lycopene biosynthesis protein 2
MSSQSTKKVAVVLSGCGHRDGAEITEAVSTLISLAEAKAIYRIFAPDMDFHVVDALTGKPTELDRNVLQESARIARGHIEPLKNLKASDFDAIVFPGGFGAALNLCTFAKEGSGCGVHAEAERVIREFHKQQKPIGAICIAPALVARVLGSERITVTIGNDAATAAEIGKTGARHENCDVDDYVSDREHRIVSTPAYMYDSASPFAVFTGIRGAIRELVEMA